MLKMFKIHLGIFYHRVKKCKDYFDNPNISFFGRYINTIAQL